LREDKRIFNPACDFSTYFMQQGMICVIPGVSCQVPCSLYVLSVKLLWSHAGTLYLGSESTERWESEVLLKGVSSQDTETGPVVSEWGWRLNRPCFWVLNLKVYS